MSLAFMQVHDRVAADLGVPFLDPVRISLGDRRDVGRTGPHAQPPDLSCVLGGASGGLFE